MNLNDIIKIAITVAVTATAIFTFNIQVTINNYNQLIDEVKTVQNDTQILKENVTKSIGIQNKILKEVD